MIDFSASTAAVRGRSGPEHPFSGAAGGFRPSTHQGSPRQIKIGQADQREHLRGVLRDPLVAHLRVSEMALDDAEHVLDPCPDRGHLVVEALVRAGQRVLLAGLERDTPEDAGLAGQALELVVHVTLVAEHRPIILTHKVRQLADVRGVGRRDRNRVHESGIDIGTDMDLHAEVPLVALLRLMHLGIALLVPVLRRGRRVDDSRIDHRAALEQQTALFERVIDDVHHLRGQPVTLEQVAELEDRRLVGHGIVGQVQTGKATHRLDLVQRIFHRRIRQRVPLLHEVDPQHRRKPHRRTAPPTRRRVVRFDHRQQCCPRHDRLHLGQEAFPASLFLLPFEGQRGEGRLLHGSGGIYDSVFYRL